MRRSRWIGRAGVVALGLLWCGGCHFAEKPKEHASAKLLDSGPQPRLSRRQEADVQVSIGRTCEAQAKLDEARLAYLEALKNDPKRADAEHRLAIIEDLKGNMQESDRHFARALKLRPKDPELLCDRGYGLYLRRRWADAEESLKQAMSIDPTHPRSHANLALVYARKGDDRAALAEFAWAGRDQADAHANLGLILALEGHLEEARQEYALALAAKPNLALAKEGLRAATIVLGKDAEARALAAAHHANPLADPALVRTSAALPKPE